MSTAFLRIAAAFLAVLLGLQVAGVAFADPPPWAPAHGWRAKQGERSALVVERPIFVEPRASGVTCDRSLLDGNNQLVGAILGGSLGGYAGSHIGSGDGRLAATAGGAVLGLLLGSELGRSIDAADAACAQYALEAAEDGRTVSWVDPARRVGYDLTPGRTFRSGEGYCREYLGTARIEGRVQRTHGTACRQPDGSWRLVN